MMKQNSTAVAKPTYFNVRDIGISLKPAGSDMVKTSQQNVVSYWYHSDSDADLIIWKDERQNIIKQQINLLGQVIEWNIVDGIRTGFVIETENTNENEKSKNEIRFDLKPTRTSVHQAIELVQHLICISDDDKKMIADNFQNAPRIASMDPQKFVAQFGRQQKPMSWLQKIIRRLFG